MTSLPVQALIPIGVIIAAIIAANISVVGLIISKDQKTSEFRQNWIDSLREDISNHIAAQVTLSILQERKCTGDADLYAKIADLQSQVVKSFSSIRLRINPNDSDVQLHRLNTRVLELLEAGRVAFNDCNWRAARSNCNELTDAAIPMLKAEWTRVKKGEISYVIAKWLAFSFLLMALAASMWLTTAIAAPGIPANGSLSRGATDCEHSVTLCLVYPL